MEKTTFLSNRPALHRHAGSLDLGEETNIVKNSVVKSFVCRRAVPPFARNPRENGQPQLELLEKKWACPVLLRREKLCPDVRTPDLDEDLSSRPPSPVKLEPCEVALGLKVQLRNEAGLQRQCSV